MPLGGTSTISKGGASFSRDPAQLRRRSTRRITRELQCLENRYPMLQRMECMALLAGGLAHDFNNVLTIINTCASELAMSGPYQEQARDVMEAVRRGKALTDRLLSLAHDEPARPSEVDPHRVVMGSLRMLRRIAGDVEIQVTAAEGLGQVRVDPGQLEQVLMNLTINACHAMSGQGTVRIFLANRDLDAGLETCEFLDPAKQPGHVVLEVADHGCGMNRRTKDRIFDPMFTTKSPDQGTGLGLFMVSNMVQEHGGTISVESAPGVGSTFSIYLPRVD